MPSQRPEHDRQAVVLLSGGLDSATVLALAVDAGFGCHCLSIDYGQRHSAELDAARNVARALGAVSHRIVNVGLDAIGGSALTDEIPVPKDRGPEPPHEIPITYVPARNTILLAVALGLAEVVGARDVFFGANAVDYSGYPDCRPDFIEAFERLARHATVAGAERGERTRIHAPLIQLTKSEIIRTGIELGVDYSLTQSCYDLSPDGAACGRCDSCEIRRRGFESAGVPDPTHYRGG
jgi:7-cyano-7-deazaguanine synthase